MFKVNSSISLKSKFSLSEVGIFMLISITALPREKRKTDFFSMGKYYFLVQSKSLYFNLAKKVVL